MGGAARASSSTASETQHRLDSFLRVKPVGVNKFACDHQKQKDLTQIVVELIANNNLFNFVECEELRRLMLLAISEFQVFCFFLSICSIC